MPSDFAGTVGGHQQLLTPCIGTPPCQMWQSWGFGKRTDCYIRMLESGCETSGRNYFAKCLSATSIESYSFCTQHITHGNISFASRGRLVCRWLKELMFVYRRDRIMGQFSTHKRVGYILLGSHLR